MKFSIEGGILASNNRPEHIPVGIGIGGGIGAGICGFIIDLWGMETMFFVCAGTTAATYIAFTYMFPEIMRREQKQNAVL